MVRIRSGGQSIWYFSKTEGPLTFTADLKPGRHIFRLKAMASEPIDLIVSAGAGQPRATGQLGRHVTDLTIHVEVTAASEQLSLTFPKAVPLAIVGGLSLFREIDEDPTRIVKRRLFNQAKRVPLARRLARSQVGKVLRPSASAAARAPAQPALAFAPWMQDRLRERQPLYQIKPKAGLFSLLTSAWNTPVPYLDALAQSVFGQWDYPTFEWIVLDNGSTEPETVAYLQSLARHPQVKLFRVEAPRQGGRLPHSRLRAKLYKCRTRCFTLFTSRKECHDPTACAC